MEQLREYPVKRASKPPHGNAKTALPFYRLEIGHGFEIPAEDYSRTNSARAHFQKKHPGVKFSSASIKDKQGRIVRYQFRRES